MSDIIQAGNQAMDEIETEKEMYDPRGEILHNFCSASAERRVETRRALQFGLDDPIQEEEEASVNAPPGPSGLQKKMEKKREASKPSPAESMTMQDRSEPSDTHNVNQNNNLTDSQSISPEQASEYMYDVDYYFPERGQVITMAVPFDASKARNRSSPKPSKKKSVQNGFVTKRKRTVSSPNKKNPSKRGRPSTQELMDFSFRSDNATNQGNN